MTTPSKKALSGAPAASHSRATQSNWCHRSLVLIELRSTDTPISALRAQLLWHGCCCEQRIVMHQDFIVENRYLVIERVRSSPSGPEHGAHR